MKNNYENSCWHSQLHSLLIRSYWQLKVHVKNASFSIDPTTVPLTISPLQLAWQKGRRWPCWAICLSLGYHDHSPYDIDLIIMLILVLICVSYDNLNHWWYWWWWWWWCVVVLLFWPSSGTGTVTVPLVSASSWDTCQQVSRYTLYQSSDCMYVCI